MHPLLLLLHLPSPPLPTPPLPSLQKQQYNTTNNKSAVRCSVTNRDGP